MEIKNIGISIPGMGNAANPANTPSTSKVQRLIITGPAFITQSPYEVKQATRVTDQGELIDETIIRAAACKSCGVVFKDASAAESVCADCSHFLCHECASKYKCHECGRQSCSRCGWIVDDVFYCFYCGIRHRTL